VHYPAWRLLRAGRLRSPIRPVPGAHFLFANSDRSFLLQTAPILGPCDRPDGYVPHPGDTCNIFVCVEGVCLRSADDCLCGNGRLDTGEQCDWSLNGYVSAALACAH
jgi:hypothetical protein